MEVISWEVELQDNDARVDLHLNKGKRIWHISLVGYTCWGAIDKVMPMFGDYLVRADQLTYAAIVARNAMRCLTRQDTQIYFGGLTNGDWYNETVENVTKCCSN